MSTSAWPPDQGPKCLLLRDLSIGVPGPVVRPDGVEIDDDVERVDVAAVHRFLAEESYWARGPGSLVVERLVREATRVVGAYDAGRQVGFARCFSVPGDLAWADVYVEAFTAAGASARRSSAS